jgi:signal transduction histidine kinase
MPVGVQSFHIRASNGDGVWDRDGIVYNITQQPFFYETGIFRVAAVAAGLLLLAGLYRLRLRQAAARLSARFDERMAERTRIARDLHDTLLQSFHGLMFRMQAARNLLPRRPDEAGESLDGAIAAAERAIDEGRSAIQDLRIPTAGQNELTELLTAMGQELANSQQAETPRTAFHITVEGERQALSPILQDEVYRIAREVLRNAFRHAHANRIETEIRYGDGLFRLRIRDDGKGIDPRVLNDGERAGHWGLPGIRERAKQIGAQLNFWSDVGAGTEVEISLPASLAYAQSHDSRRFVLFRKKPGAHAH